MHSILKPFLLRRVKTDVETALPKKREYILYAPLTAEQKDLYREILNGTGRQYLEEKATERLMAKNEKTLRSGSLKRSASSSGVSTPNKSLKSSRDSTPASTTSSARRRRAPRSYKDITDREFNTKLRKLEQGIEEDLEIESIDNSEQEEIERANTIKLASTCASSSSSLFFLVL
jgi:ATP-dependent DNA helicase